MTEKRLDFESSTLGGVTFYLVYNKKEPRECLGTVSKNRVGRFMHWCFEPDTDEYLFFTNGCLKEIVAFITKCYSRERNGK